MIGMRSLIYFTLLFAMVLTIAPMPSVVDVYRPDWVILALVYWAIALPNKVNVGTAWVCGLLLDILLGSILGVNALILSVVCYIASANYLTVRNFSVWQQAIVVGLVSAFYHLAGYWIQHFLTTAYFLPEQMWPVLTNTLIWPWVFFILRKFRRKLRIH